MVEDEGANFGILFSSDFLVKIVEVADSSQQKTLRGHDAPVLSVALDPSDEFLVSVMVFFNGQQVLFLNVAKLRIARESVLIVIFAAYITIGKDGVSKI